MAVWLRIRRPITNFWKFSNLIVLRCFRNRFIPAAAAIKFDRFYKWLKYAWKESRNTSTILRRISDRMQDVRLVHFQLSKVHIMAAIWWPYHNLWRETGISANRIWQKNCNYPKSPIIYVHYSKGSGEERYTFTSFSWSGRARYLVHKFFIFASVYCWEFITISRSIFL